MGRQYNFIFSDLVSDDDDLVGLIAYGLYKQHKIEFIKNYEDEHNGESPSEEECRAFAIATRTTSSLKGYRNKAERLLQEITLSAAKEEINSIEEEMLRNYRAEIANVLAQGKHDALREFGDVVKKHIPTWVSSVIASVVGALVFSLTVALCVYLGSTVEKNNVEMITRAVEALVADSDSTSNVDVRISGDAR